MRLQHHARGSAEEEDDRKEVWTGRRLRAPTPAGPNIRDDSRLSGNKTWWSLMKQDSKERENEMVRERES